MNLHIDGKTGLIFQLKLIPVIGKNIHDLIHHSMPDGSILSKKDCKILKSFKDGRGRHVDDEIFWHTDAT